MNTYQQRQFSPLTRSSRYKKLSKTEKFMPAHSIVRIPCLERTYGFKSNCYDKNERFLINKITQKQFNSFIRKANKIVDEELHQKSVNENKPFFPHVTISLKISFIICIIGFLLLSVIVYTKQEKDINDIILYISVGLISISVLITGISPIFLNNLEYVERDIDGNIKEKLQNLVRQQNENLIQNEVYHLMWKVETNFFWIELHMDSSKCEIKEDQ